MTNNTHNKMRVRCSILLWVPHYDLGYADLIGRYS